MKVVNVIPLKYSVDEIINISNPVGMCGTRLEGTFKLLFANQKLIENISKILASEGISIKKYIPGILSDAEPFLSSEERKVLSIIALNN
jgi:cell division protein FtsA